MPLPVKYTHASGSVTSVKVVVGQCDLDLGSSHYIRADTGLPQHLLIEKHPDQPDMLDAINTLQ